MTSRAQILTSQRPLDWALDTGELEIDEGTSVDTQAPAGGDDAPLPNVSEGSDVSHLNECINSVRPNRTGVSKCLISNSPGYRRSFFVDADFCRYGLL